MNKLIEKQIDVVIDAARTAQAENGPDPDYRRVAKEHLRDTRERLIEMIEEHCK